MQRIVVYEKKAYMMQRIKTILESDDCKIYEANTYKTLHDLLELELLNPDIILADINFDKTNEKELISNYLKKHTDTILIITTSILTKKTFIDGINIGAKDYVLQNISNDELKRKIHKYLKSEENSQIALDIIIDFRRYISGELQKADKGNYKVTVTFSTITNEFGRCIDKKETEIIKKYFSDSYWDTDSIVIYGDNHLLSIFPFSNKDTLELIELKLQHLLAEVKSKNMQLAKYAIHNTFAVFPEEGISLDDILLIINNKIENELIKT